MGHLNLKGQKIKGLYRSSDEKNWALLQTDCYTYELRLGGLKPTTEKRSEEFAINLPLTDKIIIKVKTDDFDLYFELENGECLIHSDSWIHGEGKIDFEVRLLSKSEFDKERKEWYDSSVEFKEVK
ncbi:hypothetical protein OO013_16185 [Mangrovivirga sp. M17]|uniref:Uncharacterized protein n=1 Tax=Mangrovivirga halotolerans TaxID=2993936 RepID=A0ABT3RVN0_9BACT|nr:hypothetical protein [Mangrovivirga halotolerans]MCX2745419.1 hypothetical protein [Mangrovivirga halotolerans]